MSKKRALVNRQSFGDAQMSLTQHRSGSSSGLQQVPTNNKRQSPLRSREGSQGLSNNAVASFGAGRSSASKNYARD